MSEFLTIRLGSHEGDPITWLVWSSLHQQVIASGDITDATNLAELTQYSRQRPTNVLVPSSKVLISQITVPPKATRQLNTILPFLMEDEITQDIDDMHFSVLKKQGDQVTVASIEKNYLDMWLERFEKANIEVKRMLPDSLALPLENLKISALHIGDQWLFRKNEIIGASADDAWLDIFLSSGWLDEASASEEIGLADEISADLTINNNASDAKLIIYSFSQPPEELATNLNIEWQQASPELDMVILAKGADASKINLLTGKYQQNTSMFQYWAIWKKAVIMLSLFLVIFMMNKVIETRQLESQAQSYRDESERIFRQIFPDKKRIPTVSYLKRTMEDEEKSLTGQSGAGGNNSVLDWLSLLPPVLEKAQGITIQSVSFDSDKQEVHLQIEGSNFPQFELFKEQLASSFNVEQGPASRDNNIVRGRFILRNKS